MRFTIAIALFMLLGCRGAATDVTLPVAQGPAGTYVLATIDSKSLPAQFPLGLSITSSRLVMLAAGTWTETRSGIAAGGVEKVTYFGTWVKSGGDLAFRVGSTTFYAGSATSSGLRLASGGAVLMYSRE